MPAGTSLVTAAPGAGGVCVGTTTVTCTTAPVTCQVATIVVQVSSAQIATLSATASAASSTIDPEPAANGATANTAVAVQADLSPTLTSAPDLVIAGTTNLTYTARRQTGLLSTRSDRLCARSILCS